MSAAAGEGDGATTTAGASGPGRNFGSSTVITPIKATTTMATRTRLAVSRDLMRLSARGGGAPNGDEAGSGNGDEDSAVEAGACGDTWACGGPLGPKSPSIGAGRSRGTNRAGGHLRPSCRVPSTPVITRLALMRASGGVMSLSCSHDVNPRIRRSSITGRPPLGAMTSRAEHRHPGWRAGPPAPARAAKRPSLCLPPGPRPCLRATGQADSAPR